MHDIFIFYFYRASLKNKGRIILELPIANKNQPNINILCLSARRRKYQARGLFGAQCPLFVIKLQDLYFTANIFPYVTR
jgi:hypothetical protein